jgi:hypothetical protein
MSPEESVNLSLRLSTDVRGRDVVEWLCRTLSCLLLLVELEPLRTGVLGGRRLISLFYNALLLMLPLLLLLLLLRIQLLVLLYLLVQLRRKQ